MNELFNPGALGPVDKIAIETREQWLALRLQDVTASDVASITGHGYRSPLSVWAEKTGRVPPTAENNIMRRGRWFEPAIFAALADEKPTWQIKRAGVYLRAPAHRIGATPDGVAVDPEREGLGIVQGKVVSRGAFRRNWLADPEDEFSPVAVPVGYQLQTLTEAMLAGAAWAVVAALVVSEYDAELHVLDVPRHAVAEQRILSEVAAFWWLTDNSRRPEVTPAKDAGVIKALYPEDDGSEIDLTGDNEAAALWAEREALNAELKARKGRTDEITTVLKAKIGGASYARLADGRRLSCKLVRRDSYVAKASEYRTLRAVKG